ncbi:MAG: hypothetical protein H0U76_16805 [Ktedonobacteraceae bacterium]|nr:hypothetical protein [Ktedonobacteraceae bacterium]
MIRVKTFTDAVISSVVLSGVLTILPLLFLHAKWSFLFGIFASNTILLITVVNKFKDTEVYTNSRKLYEKNADKLGFILPLIAAVAGQIILSFGYYIAWKSIHVIPLITGSELQQGSWIYNLTSSVALSLLQSILLLNSIGNIYILFFREHNK